VASGVIFAEFVVTRVLLTARISNVESTVCDNKERKMHGKFWATIFSFPSGTQIVSLSHARDKLNIPSFSCSLLVFQEVAHLMNAVLDTMARLKCKVRHENFLFGLKIRFCLGWEWGGAGAIGFGERSFIKHWIDWL